jgi:hypothetical protein
MVVARRFRRHAMASASAAPDERRIQESPAGSRRPEHRAERREQLHVTAAGRPDQKPGNMSSSPTASPPSACNGLTPVTRSGGQRDAERGDREGQRIRHAPVSQVDDGAGGATAGDDCDHDGVRGKRCQWEPRRCR